ncbi:MAG: methionine--tRNA ligase [Bacteroidetes bacterium]|nr:MAG: methionine--tRNA ligase [Bacteroidota bacterium]
MRKAKRTLVTSALPYANGPLHLGHLAGAYLPADIYVRYLRLQGREVAYICGSDEHGAAITIRAKKEGISPRAIVDKYHALNKDTFEKLGISFDYYHRTSAPLHHKTAQDFFLKLYNKGDEFEEITTEQYYDEAFNQFLADRYITGECPKCGHPEAYGDQCEKCGSTLSPTELINPKSTLSGQTPVRKTTTHWYFKLDKHEAWLREWIESGTLDGKPHHNPDDWKKHVVQQCLSWISNLRPRAITRDLDWGIPVPVEGAEGKVLYVWFDAPIGYISSTKQWALETGQDWETWWKDEETDLIHFIGKDNIVFHCIIFPAMLRAHGDFILPKNVPANQFLNYEGQKFSKSRGWGIEQHEYLEAFKDFPNKEDALRYALIRNMPENRDADFKWDDFVEFYDKELADNLGNFVNRVIVLTQKYYGGKVPDSATNLSETLAPVRQLAEDLCASIEHFSFKAAANTFMEISSWGNTWLQDVSPWKIYKTAPDSPVIAECMYVSLQVVTLLSLLCEPFIPFTAPKIRKLLNLDAPQNGDLQKALERLRAGEPLLPAGHEVGKPEILFAKIHDRKDTSRLDIINRQKAKLEAVLAAERSKQRPELKPVIQFDDFAKLDIRTARIVAAEKMKKADKLLKLTVDLGFETRTVVSGLAQHFKPEDLINKKVLLVANLAPRKLRGVESQGMILTAEDGEGKLYLVSAEGDVGEGFAIG